MNTCDTCKWWGKAHKFDPVDAFRGCLNNKLSASMHSGSDLACPDADDDFRIGFYTGPKFGCIHHEPK